jgi:hypothetical protein
LADADTEDGYLLATEWPIYVFDAVAMVLVLGICWWWYVGDITSCRRHRRWIVLRARLSTRECIRVGREGGIMVWSGDTTALKSAQELYSGIRF